MKRLAWLIVGRPLLAAPLLTLLLFSFHSSESTPDGRLFYFLIVLRGCLTLFCFIVFRGTKNSVTTPALEAFTAVQLVLDLFLESVLIGVTGHVESPFSILYIGTIVSSAFIFYEKGGVLSATAALLLLGITVFLKESRPFVVMNPTGFDTPYRLFLHAVAFYSTGLVSGLFFSKSRKEFKLMEEEVSQKRRLAIVGEMAAGMAHEIRNPLAALSGAIQLLRNESSLQGETRHLMDIALHETDRLNAIITDFLLYAKPNPPRKRWVSLDHLLGESVELIKKSSAVMPATSAEPIQVFLKMEDPLFKLFVDPDQLKQVFWNLSVNAFAAMPQGGSLTLTTKQVSSKMEVYFQDTGSGISESDFPKIFYPFFTTKSSGSGLGLPIIQRIIEQHDGSIEVTSGAAGTTVKIGIPIWKKF